ncbi:MAG: hypothetical protein HPY44_22175 [Armatimonadetes bacterium]|nr:hypothetical protein [Armatimonadota bacterium]
MKAPGERTQCSAAQSAVVFVLAAGACLLAGIAAWRAGRADLDALAALSHAFDVVHREARFNLGLVGFGAPPLPTLLYLPLCVSRSLATSGLACPVLGAVMLGLTACLLNGALAGFGLRGAFRWPLIAILVLHPLTLSLGALGSPGIIFAASLTGAAFALMRWSQDEGFRDLVTCSLLLTAAALTHYAALWLVITAALYVAWRTRRDRQGWARTEGTLIAFLLPIVYCYAVWIGANWAIMGDPLNFVRAMTPPESASACPVWWPLAAVLAAFPPILGLIWHELRGVARRNPPGRAGAWLVIGGMLGGLWSCLAGEGSVSRTPWQALPVLAVTSAAVGLSLLGVIAAQYTAGAGSARKSLWLSVLLALLGIPACSWLNASGHGIPVSPTYEGKPALSVDVSGHRAAGDALRHNVQPERKAYVIGGDGYAVSLFAGVPKQTVLMDASELPRVPIQEGDVVLQPSRNSLAPLELAAAAKALVPREVTPPDTGTWRAFTLARR